VWQITRPLQPLSIIRYKRALCLLAIVSASIIAACVLGLGTLRVKGSYFSTATLVKNTCTASETESPIEANVSVASNLILSSTLT
jgi:cytochrome c-type biogenesis protein CcmE